MDNITINVGKTYAADGVTYTALSTAQLTTDSDGKISGIASGSVAATVTDADTSPTVTFDASDSAIEFTATSDGSIITVTQLFPIEFISGEFTCKGNTLTIGVGATLAIESQRGNYSLRNENTFEFGGKYTFTNTALTTESQHTVSTYTLTDGTNVRTLNLEQFGTVINNFAEQGFTLTKDSSEVMTIGNYTLTATADADTALNLDINEDGVNLIPKTGDGSLNISISRGDTEVFSGELECTGGSITFGYDHAVTFAKDTSFTFKRNGYTFAVSTTDKATTDIELTDTGISFTPNQDDGALNFSMSKNGATIFGGQLNVTGGTISFNPSTQKISFTEGTNVSLALGDGSQQLDFKVVDDDASFKVAADSDGNFTFTPDEGDGSLEISIANNGTTIFRNTVNINGSVIFNLSTRLLTLTDGTEAQVKFDNYTLTATADGNAASEISLTAEGISFTPQAGDGTLNLTLGTAAGDFPPISKF